MRNNKVVSFQGFKVLDFLPVHSSIISLFFLFFKRSSISSAQSFRTEEVIGVVKLSSLPLSVTTALGKLCQAVAAKHRAKH